VAEEVEHVREEERGAADGSTDFDDGIGTLGEEELLIEEEVEGIFVDVDSVPGEGMAGGIGEPETREGVADVRRGRGW
jgi:hypothetical protein